MTLTVKSTPEKRIEGKLVSTHLLAELQAFRDSGNESADLLNPILNSMDQYQIILQAGKPTATSKKTVTVNLRETNAENVTTLEETKELVESTIFELINARNSEKFAELESWLMSGRLQIRAYGCKKARFEAEASWLVARILKARANYVPSIWGQKTIQACEGYPNLNSFSDFFVCQPHSTALGTMGTPLGLSSQEFYAFNAAVMVATKRDCFDRQFDKLGIKASYGNNKPFKVQKLINLLPPTSTFSLFDPNKAAAFYWLMIDFIKEREQANEMQVNWKGGRKAEYEFSEDMKKITNNIMSSDIKKIWNVNKNNNALS